MSLCHLCGIAQASPTGFALSNHVCAGGGCTCQVGRHDGVPARSPQLPRPALSLPPMPRRSL